MIMNSDLQCESSFVESGEKALEELKNYSFDFLISDMRMPNMNGIQLLTEVKARYPEITRFILSGSTDWDLVVNCVGLAHQYVLKPVNYDILESKIVRAFNLKRLLSNRQIESMVSGLRSLPSLPQIFIDIHEELQSSSPSLKRVGKIISKDIGMSAKTLQLVNSAFFGLGQTVSSPVQATTLLGIETIKALALTTQIFAEVDQKQIPLFDFDELWNHSILVGRVANKLAKQQNLSKEEIEHSMIAGLLHDTGKLILAANLPDQYSIALALSEKEKISLIKAEQEIFGTSHAEIGAYLFGIWGLPIPIIEAVAYHHTPGECATVKFDALAAVHIANAINNELKEVHFTCTPSKIDLEFLAKLGFNNQYSNWRDTGRELIAQGNNNV